MKLKDRVAIVTGAGQGIGKAIAMGLAGEGATVVIAERNAVTGKAAEEAIRKLGQNAVALVCDVAKEEDIRNMAGQTLERFGKADVLVNNAAAMFNRPVWDTPLARWEQVFRVNLTAPFLCCQAVLPGMMKQKSGSIINMSSQTAIARITSKFTGMAYAVSKAAVERFTWSMASEVGQFNIAVNALKPRRGIITEGVKATMPESAWAQFDSTDMIVKAAILLARQDGSGITGIVATDEEYCAWHGL